MAEVVKIRLVRCPKCANLLTELPGFSFYQCGECGAVLEAKKKDVLSDGLAETCDNAKDVRTSVGLNVCNMSDVGMKSIDGTGRGIIEKYNNERVTSTGSSLLRLDDRESLSDFDASQQGKERIRRLRYRDDENRSYSQGLVRHRNHDDEFPDSNLKTPEYNNYQGEEKRSDSFPYYDERMRFRDRGLYGFSRVEKLEYDRAELLSKLDELTDKLNRPWDMDDKPNERMVSSIPPGSYGRHHDAYAQERLNSSHGLTKTSILANDLESPYGSHIYGRNPPRSRLVSGMQDSYYPSLLPHEFGGLNHPPQSPSRSMYQQYQEDFHGYYSDTKPELFMLHQHGHFLHQEDFHGFYSDTNRNSYITPRIDHFKSQHQLYNPFINQHPNPILHVSQGYSSGGSTFRSRQAPTVRSGDLEYENEGFGKVDVAPQRGRLCHPILGGAPFITCCKCFELLKLPRKHLSLAKMQKMKCGSCFSVISFELGNTGYVVSVSSHSDPIATDVGISPNKAGMNVCSNNRVNMDKSNHDESERQLDPLLAISSISADKYNTPRSEKTISYAPEKQLHTLSANSSISVDKRSMTNKSNSKSSKKLIDSINKLNYDGFEKLQNSLSSASGSSADECRSAIDHKSISGKFKKQVDPLSSMTTVSVGNQGLGTEKKSKYGESERQVDTHFATLGISMDEHITNTDKEYDDKTEKLVDTHFASPSISMNEHIANTDKKYDDESEKQVDTHFSTPSISTGEHIGDDISNNDEPKKLLCLLSSTDVTSEEQSNLPKECHLHCSDGNVNNQLDVGDESKQSEVALDWATPLQITANNSAMATVTDVPVSAFSNSSIFCGPEEISEEGYPQVNLRNKSVVLGVKRSSHDFSDYDGSVQFNESKVFVNGHFIPNHDVKNAEKLAGPIQPGEYWYDIRAGFWGVMGRPCLGIIMPNIEEFNYRLPENCAAGNTGVLVNGRELHQKDLDILAGRGLPILKHRSYIIDISGRVVDEHTGEELDDLGKLGPTVERQRRGFGMKVP